MSSEVPLRKWLILSLNAQFSWNYREIMNYYIDPFVTPALCVSANIVVSLIRESILSIDPRSVCYYVIPLNLSFQFTKPPKRCIRWCFSDFSNFKEVKKKKRRNFQQNGTFFFLIKFFIADTTFLAKAKTLMIFSFD